VATAMFGFGMASMFPCMMTLAEHFVELTGRTASIIVVGAALGEMLIPMIIGSLFGQKGPQSFTVAVIVFCFIAITAFTVFYTVSFFGKKAHQTRIMKHALASHEHSDSEKLGAHFLTLTMVLSFMLWVVVSVGGETDDVMAVENMSEHVDAIRPHAF
jgi:MFS family permease